MNDKPSSMIKKMPVKYMTVHDYSEFMEEAHPIISDLLDLVLDCHLKHYLDPKSRKTILDSWMLLTRADHQLSFLVLEKLYDQNEEILKNRKAKDG